MVAGQDGETGSERVGEGRQGAAARRAVMSAAPAAADEICMRTD